MRPQGWPDGHSYVEAVQNANNLGDAELRGGQYERRSNGLPKPYSGGFTTTFHYSCAGGDYALRCFTRGNDDLERRYHAITEFLRLVQNRAFCEAVYLSRGIRVDGQWWPVIKMLWVKGRQFNFEVETKLRDGQGLAALAAKFRDMVRSLSVLGVAHGDLQHGNIIVANDELRLIDYDGIYLPALFGMLPSEFGHQNYQHPDRPTAPFDGRLDRFSSIVIYTAVTALAADSSLWPRFNNDENLLFTRDDFTSAGASPLFRALQANVATSKLANGLLAACRLQFDQVPTLEQVIQGVVPSAPLPGARPFSAFVSPTTSGQASQSATAAAARPRPPAPQPIQWSRAQMQSPPRPPAPPQPQTPVANNQPVVSSYGTPLRRKTSTPLIILAAALVIGLVIIAWPRGQRVQFPPYSSPQQAAASRTYGAAGSQVPSGSCNSPNATDIRSMEMAITEFHRNVVAHNWDTAAWYESTDKFLPKAAMIKGYQNTMASDPTISAVNGCKITVALKFQDYGQPRYCITIQYQMEFARAPTRRWIIGDAQSQGDKVECS